jgi:hypothetical protein
MSEAQSRDRRQRVQNIAHSAQADDEQAEVGLRVQRMIFAQAISDQLSAPGDQLSAPFAASEALESAKAGTFENGL